MKVDLYPSISNKNILFKNENAFPISRPASCEQATEHAAACSPRARLGFLHLLAQGRKTEADPKDNMY